MIARALVLALIMFCLVWPHIARAQEGDIGQGHQHWHEGFYMNLQRPDVWGSCCNLSDCRPTSGRMVDDHYEVKVNGVWTRVLPHKIVKRQAPDGGFHVCAPHGFTGLPEQIYCVVIPAEG